MLRGYRQSLALLAISAALLAAGCGEEESEEPAEARVETAHEVPELPAGWTVQRNQNAGFAFGVPPGWTAKNDGIRATVRSPDKLVAATIVADRTDGALEFPLDEFAETAITGIAGIRKLEPGETKEYRHRYDAVVIDAEGIGVEKDIHQKVDLFVLRRDGLANLTVLVARNAEQDTKAYDDDIKRMIGSLRTRPPG
jgi:hypothetical protein